MRPSGRETSQMRALRFVHDYTKYAEGSVLAEFGDTRVLCTASIDERVHSTLVFPNSTNTEPSA